MKVVRASRYLVPVIVGMSLFMGALLASCGKGSTTDLSGNSTVDSLLQAYTVMADSAPLEQANSQLGVNFSYQEPPPSSMEYSSAIIPVSSAISPSSSGTIIPASSSNFVLSSSTGLPLSSSNVVLPSSSSALVLSSSVISISSSSIIIPPSSSATVPSSSAVVASSGSGTGISITAPGETGAKGMAVGSNSVSINITDANWVSNNHTTGTLFCKINSATGSFSVNIGGVTGTLTGYHSTLANVPAKNATGTITATEAGGSCGMDW